LSHFRSGFQEYGETSRFLFKAKWIYTRNLLGMILSFPLQREDFIHHLEREIEGYWIMNLGMESGAI